MPADFDHDPVVELVPAKADDLLDLVFLFKATLVLHLEHALSLDFLVARAWVFFFHSLLRIQVELLYSLFDTR